MSDEVHANFGRTWLAYVTHGSSLATELAKARRLMNAHPDYDEAKYRAAILAADAIRNGNL